ncbi:MAG: CU044_5270 family protein [Jatrophihabitantaceae bacterium]
MSATLDQLLADTAHVDDLPAALFARGLDELDAAIERHASLARVPIIRTPPHRKLRRGGLVAAAVAAVITIPIIAGGVLHPGDAAAATVLRQAGHAAGTQPGGWPDDAYWHVTSTYVRDGHTYQRDIWIAHHGEAFLLDRGLPGDPGVISLGASIFDAGAAQLTWDQLYALPTNPGELATALRRDAQGGGTSLDEELFAVAADLLRESPAPPALREALYDVAANTSGVHLKGKVTDPAGRIGTAVERDGETLIIDTATGQLLDDTQGDNFSATYLSQGPTNSAPPLTTK